MTTPPVYMITAAAGNIGKRLVSYLLSLHSGPHVVLPTSNATKLQSSLPGTLDKSRIHIVEGSIKDPHFVESILKKHHVDGVSLALTGDDELFTTTNILDAIQRSGTVKHVVYISACEDYSLDAIKNGSLRGQSAAHVLVKYLIEAKFRHGLPPREAPGGLSWTILGPSLFFDNDYMIKEQILEHSIFGVPLGDKGVNDGRIWGGRKVMIGSLKAYTGGDIAQLWAQALGKDVKPTLADRKGLDSLETSFGQVAGPAWGRDLRLMYETFAQRGFFDDDIPYGASEYDYTEVYACAERSAKRRRFMTTKNELMGWAPSDMYHRTKQHLRIGDQIAIVLGCSTPLAVRQVGGRFQVLGETFVQGLMDGQAMEGLKAGTFELQTLSFE